MVGGVVRRAIESGDVKLYKMFHFPVGFQIPVHDVRYITSRNA